MNITLSLKTKITIVFAFLFALLILAALPFYNMQKTKASQNVIDTYERLTHNLREERLPRKELVKYLENLNFTQVQNPKQILDSADRSKIRRKGFELLIVNNIYYLHIMTPHFRVLLQDNSNKFQRSYIDVFVLLFIVGLFVFIYYLIIKNINDSEHQLKSRQLFLRTVMHELKTPIAKGRIVSELIDDEKQKNRIITIFEKLNFLIDDFAKVEQIVSNNYSPNMYSCNLENAIKKSIEMLMLESNENIILENISDKRINVDLDLFALAIKNLIDNGLKYSTNSRVLIKVESNQIHFISDGEKLPKSLEEYFKPFHNDTKFKNHGMGLGLYIINAIVQMHNMDLQYAYLENQNIFKILLEK